MIRLLVISTCAFVLVYTIYGINNSTADDYLCYWCPVMIRTMYRIPDHIFEHHLQDSHGTEVIFRQNALCHDTELTVNVTSKLLISLSEIQIIGLDFIWENMSINHTFTIYNAIHNAITRDTNNCPELKLHCDIIITNEIYLTLFVGPL